MAFKPNYNFQKVERARAKAQKKHEKLKRLQMETEKATDKDTKIGTDAGNSGDGA